MNLELLLLACSLTEQVTYGGSHGLLLGEGVHLLLHGDELLLPFGQRRGGFGPLGLQLCDSVAQADRTSTSHLDKAPGQG